MYPHSSLTAEQRLAAVDLFEEGFGHVAVSSRLGVSAGAVEKLGERFRIWGRAALEGKPTKQVYSFEFKLELVRRYLSGEGTAMDLALKHQLNSPAQVRNWAKIYREQGEDGLRPKPKGRPRAASSPEPTELTELEKLRRENQRLQAENAYLKKVRALRNHPPR